MTKTRLPKPDIGKDAIHLSKFGYDIHTPVKQRRLSLKKASRQHNKLDVLRRLNLIRNITKKGTINKRKLTKDVEFMKKLYKEGTKNRRTTRRVKK